VLYNIPSIFATALSRWVPATRARVLISWPFRLARQTVFQTTKETQQASSNSESNRAVKHRHTSDFVKVAKIRWCGAGGHVASCSALRVVTQLANNNTLFRNIDWFTMSQIGLSTAQWHICPFGNRYRFLADVRVHNRKGEWTIGDLKSDLAARGPFYGYSSCDHFAPFPSLVLIPPTCLYTLWKRFRSFSLSLIPLRSL
jgi:hypothetical protein